MVDQINGSLHGWFDLKIPDFDLVHSVLMDCSGLESHSYFKTRLLKNKSKIFQLGCNIYRKKYISKVRLGYFNLKMNFSTFTKDVLLLKSILNLLKEKRLKKY